VSDHDRRNWHGILWGFGLATFLLVGAAWGVDRAAGGDHDRAVSKLIVGGVVGFVVLSIAIGELVWRLRHGPQEPGRHTREG